MTTVAPHPGTYVEVHANAPAPDAAVLDRLTPDATELQVAPVTDGNGALRVSFYSGAAPSLPRVLRVLGSLDLEVVDQRQALFRRADGLLCRVNEFRVVAGRVVETAIESGAYERAAVADTLRAVWSGAAEADRFNALVLAAALDWREVAVLRAYSRFLRQTSLPYGQVRIESILLAHPSFAAAIVELFRVQFDPRRRTDRDARDRQATDVRSMLALMLDEVEGLDADRVLRAFVGLVAATVRTSFYREDSLTAAKPHLAFKLRSGEIAEIPEPKPAFEIFVYSPEMEGVHLRYGMVARGGLRWSDRVDDYRTEVLGLAKAQAVKNAVIVPAGAKGGFVVRHLPEAGSARAELGRRCYRQFVTGLLDVTDNLSATGETVHPDGVVCRDGDDPYLVVAADKGTATFSDLANEVAVEAGHWLGDAFASGGSVGYDHKKMGITAKGAWVSVERHLAEVGIDSGSDTFTVAGIGDMSGDVFGNAMLLSRGIVLVAAFDHRHIFLDPTPARDAAWRERARLSALPTSSWADYDTATISAGGGVWSRQSKSVPVGAEVRAALGLDDSVTSLSPVEMIRAILTAPVDVLFNGGIGTYVKAAAEPHVAAGDKANDGVRVDATAVRARIVGEGGNLGFTSRGRIEFARNGGRINTDAIDNAAGVDCSDHEVNIKILLDGAVEPRRAELLAEMTDDVAAAVLANNRAQNRILSDSRSTAARMVSVHARMVEQFEHTRGFDRTLESLPSADDFGLLEADGAGLTSPELAILLAHTKLDLKADLAESALFDDIFFAERLRRYFPERLARHPHAEHPLRRQIVATEIVNDIVAVGGLTYAYRLREETGASATDIVRAFVVVSRIFGIGDLVADIIAARLSPAVENELVVEARRLLDRGSRWFLANRPQPLAPVAEIARFEAVLAEHTGDVASWLRGEEADAVAQARARYESAGAPAAVAQSLAEGLYRFSLLDVFEVADEAGLSVAEVARVYFTLSAHLGIDRWLIAVSQLPWDRRLNSLARLALRDDFYLSLRLLTRDVLGCGVDGAAVDRIAHWERANEAAIERGRRNLAGLGDASHDLPSLSVAARYVRSMAGQR